MISVVLSLPVTQILYHNNSHSIMLGEIRLWLSPVGVSPLAVLVKAHSDRVFGDLIDNLQVNAFYSHTSTAVSDSKRFRRVVGCPPASAAFQTTTRCQQGPTIDTKYLWSNRPEQRTIRSATGHRDSIYTSP